MYFIFVIVYGWVWFWKFLYKVVVLVFFIGVSNFFELVVVVVIVLFGLESGVVLVIVVGVFEEVLIMLSFVWIVNKIRGFFIVKFEVGNVVLMFVEE